MYIEYWEVPIRDTRKVIRFSSKRDAHRLYESNSYEYGPPHHIIMPVLYEYYDDFVKNYYRDQALAKLTANERKALGL